MLASVAAAGFVLGAEVGGPLQTVVVLWFLLVCPGLALTGRFPIPKLLHRWILVLAVSLTVDILTAEALLSVGRWSPINGYLAIAGITIAGVAVSLFIGNPAKVSALAHPTRSDGGRATSVVRNEPPAG